MRRATWISGVMVAMAVAGTGCPVGDVPAAQPCEEWAMATCRDYSRCGSYWTLLFGDDVPLCAERLALACEREMRIPGTGLTPEWRAGCAAASGELSCNDLFTGRIPDACKPPRGMLADASPCHSSLQCASGYCTAFVCGKCAPRFRAGAACPSGQAGQCEEGLVCNGETCVPEGGAGAACSPARGCEPGLTCLRDKCRAPGDKGVGESCEAEGLDCRPPLRCDPKSRLCVTYKFPKLGEACSFGCSGARCENGICIPYLRDGEKCEPGSAGDCLAPADCGKGGICEIAGPRTCK